MTTSSLVMTPNLLLTLLLLQICQAMVSLIERSLASSDAAGRGTDVLLAELAVRALGRVALMGTEGQRAVLGAKGVKRLVAVVRADSNALEAVLNDRCGGGVRRGG